jgi:hypothetical protein
MDYLQIGEMEDAKLLLERVIKDEESQFRQDANWYVGLILTQEGRYLEAILYLKASDRAEAKSLITQLQEMGK